ncbi:MAG: FG-GAP-like repeat-containing protein [Rubripirellula sp.]
MESRLADAERFLKSEQYGKASTAIEAVLIEQPDHGYGQFLYAQIRHGQGDSQAAQTILDEAAKNSPEHAERFLNESARLLISDGDIIGAIAQYERLLKISPDDTKTRRLVASLQNQLGLRFDANEHFRILCRSVPMEIHELRCLLAPTSDVGRTKATQWASQSNQSLVNALIDLHRNRIEECVAQLNSAPLVQQKNPAAMCLLGFALSMQRDDDAFTRWYAQREKAWDRYPDFWIAIGNAMTLAGKHDEGIRAYAAAVAREPMHRSAVLRLGQSLAAVGQTDDAKLVMARAKEIGDLVELVGNVAATPRSSANAFNILASEQSRMGQPYQAWAWRFIGTSLFDPRSATMQHHAMGLASAKSLFDRDKQRSVSLCHVKVEPLTYADLRSDLDKATEPIAASDSQRWSQNSSATPVYQNVAQRTGLDFRYINANPVVHKDFLLHQALGAGIACIDFDLDGRVDVYAAQGGFNVSPRKREGSEPASSNALFRNLGKRFVEVCTKANSDDLGYSMGVTAGDWNQDGFQDLVIGNMFANTLMINQGDGTFHKATTGKQWNRGVYTTGVAIADLNGDALPEILEVNYVDDERIFTAIKYGADGKPLRYPGPTQFRAGVDRVFFSVGDGSMASSILAEPPNDPDRRAAMGLVVGDFDGKPGNEVFVANDQTANHFWKANRSDVDIPNRFTDLALVQGVGLGVRGMPLASMGVAVADFDLNGRPDLHVTTFNDELSNHFLQQPSGAFDDQIIASGIGRHSREHVGFGTQAVDFDNNSTEDLWVGNGHIEDFNDGQDFKMPIQLLVHSQDGFQQADLPDDEPFFQAKHLSRALARLDWNNDGLVDVVVGDLEEPLALLENQTETSNGWISIQIVGTRCERDAIGAKIEIQAGDKTLYSFVCTGDGYMCRNQNRVFVGLGQNARIDRLAVFWPDGTKQVTTELSVNQHIIITQGIDDAFVCD